MDPCEYADYIDWLENRVLDDHLEREEYGLDTPVDPDPDGEAESSLRVGSLVVATRATAICRAGERGVCVEAYRLGDRPGGSILFERGGYDGFSPDEVALILSVTGAVCLAVAHYRFTNVSQLRQDFRQGGFQTAFHVKPQGPDAA